VAAQGEVVAGRLVLGLGQVRLDPQLGRGLVEFRDAPGGKTRLTEHAHLGKVRAEPVDDVVVRNPGCGDVASIAVGHHANQASAYCHQLEHHRQGKGPRSCRMSAASGISTTSKGTGLLQRGGRHGHEGKGAFAVPAARLGHRALSRRPPTTLRAPSRAR